MRVALIQTRTPATQAAALDHVLPLVRQAAEAGAELILQGGDAQDPLLRRQLTGDRLDRVTLLGQGQD